MKVHRSLACMLMASLPFISCFSGNAKLGTAEKMPNSTETSISPILEEQSFKSREGHVVNFNRTKKGELKAIVKLDYLRDPYVGLPVYIDRGLDQQEVDITQLKEWEKNRLIHVQLKGQQTPYIYIAHEGLLGGGKKKKKKKNNNTNKKKKENKKKKQKKEEDTEDPSENLSFPNPTALSVGKHLPNEEAESLMEKAQNYKEEGKENPTYLQFAINSFLKLANQEYSPIQHEAMYQLGLICEEQGQSELAVRWYVAAFENSWWEDPQQAHNSLACQALKSLGHERIPLIYPSDITKEDIRHPMLKLDIYMRLIEFYQNGTPEPYLSKEENKNKLNKLTNARDLILQSKENLQAFNLLKEEMSAFASLIDQGDYEKAETCGLVILKKTPFRQCLYNLGVLYGRQNEYQKAAECYQKAKTHQSFLNLGNLYYRGLIGKINGEIDYQTLVKYFEISGCPEALHNLSIIYKEGYIGQPDYQKAEEYLKKAGSGDADSLLGSLYMQGYIGNNTPHPDYTLAACHLDKAIRKGCIDAWLHLGVLYYLGHTGVNKDNNEPNYKRAVECFEKATETPTNYFLLHLHQEKHFYWEDAWWNLGIVYLKGHYGKKNGKPDYETAKEYFEKSGKPEAIYNIGLLYEQGHLGNMDSEKEEQRINYQKALEYYQRSARWEAKLAILHFYQLGHITTNSPKEKKEIINKTIADIDDLLLGLPTDKQLYIQGMVAYYMGNWKDALVTLKDAWMQGSQEVEVPKLIELLESYYAGKVEEEIEIKETPIETTIIEPLEKEELLKIIEEPKSIEIEIKTQVLPIEAEEEFTEKHIKLQQVTAWKTLTKAQKKIIKTQRDREKFLDNFKDHLSAPQQPGGPVELEFINDRTRQAFQTFRENNLKLKEILKDLTNNPWSTEGVGQPEVLKGNLSGYMSRRITDEDRLVYKLIGNKIRVFSWEGHYKNVKKF